MLGNDPAIVASADATGRTNRDKIMADPRMKPERNPMPFDGKCMIYGGFEPII